MPNQIQHDHLTNCRLPTLPDIFCFPTRPCLVQRRSMGESNSLHAHARPTARSFGARLQFANSRGLRKVAAGCDFPAREGYAPRGPLSREVAENRKKAGKGHSPHFTAFGVRLKWTPGVSTHEPGLCAFRLPFTPFAPTCAPVRSGLGQGRVRAFKARSGSAGGSSALPGLFRPRPAKVRTDARDGIRPRGQLGHQDRRIQPPGRNNVN